MAQKQDCKKLALRAQSKGAELGALLGVALSVPTLPMTIAGGSLLAGGVGLVLTGIDAVKKDGAPLADYHPLQYGPGGAVAIPALIMNNNRKDGAEIMKEIARITAYPGCRLWNWANGHSGNNVVPSQVPQERWPVEPNAHRG